MSRATPTVSICMPHLNSGRFVHDRMRSILAQSLTDWELIVVDSASDDGSLEVLHDFASRDARIAIHQAPRDGIYSNINRAIELGRGRFVYIATSDDTMAPDCLEKMVAALDRHRECGLAHCRLSIIDDRGVPVGGQDAWESYEAQRYFGDWMRRTHIRRAPHDGILHFQFFTVYTSLTQILVRREVYGRIGLFRTDCGSYADFAWGMRAGLTENVVHVPDAVATWRRHERQATRADALRKSRVSGAFVLMTRETLTWLETVHPVLAKRFQEHRMLRHYLYDQLEACVRRPNDRALQIAGIMRFAAREPAFMLSLLGRRLRGLARGRRAFSIADDLRGLMPDGGLVEA